MARPAVRFLRSHAAVSAAAFLLAVGGGVAGCGRGFRAPRQDPPVEPVRAQVTVLLGGGEGFHYALAPLHPEAERARRDGEALASRFSLAGAGLARLHVFRFESAPADFDPKETVVHAVSEAGEEVTLRPLVTFRVPQAPRDALVFRALAGPTEHALLPGGSWLSLAVVVPGTRDPERFRRAEVAGAPLEPVSLDREEWKRFLAAPKRDFFRRVARPATAPSGR